MSSTLQLQTTPKRAGVWMHAAYDAPPTVDPSHAVEGDWDERQTNAEGYAAFLHVDGGRSSYVLVRAPGYRDQVVGPILMPHDELITVTLHRTPPPRLTWINRDRHRMMTEDGQPVFLKGATAFLLYKRFLDGEDIAPFLQQHADLGFTMIRVMGMFESLGGFNPKAYPDYYDRIGDFLDRCGSFGLYVYWVCCAATGAWMTPDEAVDHVRRSLDQLRTRDNALASPVNEQGQHNNSIPLERIRREWFGSLLHDMGSYGGDTPCSPPYGTHCVLHTTRQYPGLVKDSNPIDNRNFVEGFDVGIDEPYRAGEDGSGTNHDQPHIAAEAAGCAWMALFWVFHSLQGQRCELLHGNTLACAERAIDAMGRF